MPPKIHSENHKVSILPIFTLFESDPEPRPLHEVREESEAKGLTYWIVPASISRCKPQPLGEPDERR